MEARGPGGHTMATLTCGRQQQGAVLAIQIFQGSNPGVTWVTIVEVIQLLTLLPIPEAAIHQTQSMKRDYTVYEGRPCPVPAIGACSPNLPPGISCSHYSMTLPALPGDCGLGRPPLTCRPSCRASRLYNWVRYPWVIRLTG